MLDYDDHFDFFHNDIKYFNSNDDHQKDIFDFPIHHSTPSIARCKPSTRPVDFPSIKKHYGIVTFFDIQLPIIYR